MKPEIRAAKGEGSENTNDTFYAPLSTYEAALLASCSRRCKAFNRCGGIRFEVLDEAMSRPSSTSQIQARLLRSPDVCLISCRSSPKMPIPPFARELQLEWFHLDGQMTGDKKPAWGNVTQPRGLRVIAWGVLMDEACQEVLKCTTKELKWALFIPSLPVDVVGGGTIYDTQKECLELLNCSVPEMKRRLAGLIAAFALALDVSTVSAFTTNTFSGAHERLRQG
ncbi:hypothetical protein VTN00DRAFT_5889 [Thermoascus crustaceus]|uniref:uncharacterized protein n=1 Tax=Thermoascus crustaceus TaxID=5088 RepID=UPI003744B0F7